MKWFIVPLLLLVVSCINKRLIIKEIKHENAILTWYRESYISNTTAFVELKILAKQDTLLMCSDDAIINIDLKDDSVIIKVYDVKNFPLYKYKTQSGRYNIILKEGGYNEWKNHYHPDEANHNSR